MDIGRNAYVYFCKKYWFTNKINGIIWISIKLKGGNCMEVSKISSIKELEINQKLNEPYMKRKQKKREKQLSFSEVLNLVNKK